MPFVSRPAAVVLLSCCLAFGILLGFTGFTAKDSRPTATAAANAALRGFNEEEEEEEEEVSVIDSSARLHHRNSVLGAGIGTRPGIDIW